MSFRRGFQVEPASGGRPDGFLFRSKANFAERSETRIAVVGASLVGRTHAEIVSGTARLDAIIDPEPDAGRIAKRHGAHWHPDLAEYLRSGRPDGAIVAAPITCICRWPRLAWKPKSRCWSKSRWPMASLRRVPWCRRPERRVCPYWLATIVVIHKLPNWRGT